MQRNATDVYVAICTKACYGFNSIQGSDEAQASRPGGPASQASRPPKKKNFFFVTLREIFFFFLLGKIFRYLAKFGKKIWILLTSLLDRL